MNQTQPTIASSPFRYYCHNCCTQVRVTEFYKCVVCSSGAVEEIGTWNSNPATSPAPAPARDPVRQTIPAEPNIDSDIDNDNNERSDLYESLVSTSFGTNETEETMANTPRPSNISNALVNGVLDVVDIIRGGRNDATTQSRASTSRQAMSIVLLRERIHSLLFALGEERRRITNRNNVSATDSNEHGNLASDLENMLMRTLGLLFSATSRPLSKEKLDLIPKVNINADDLANHQRCSICWEEFQIDESVRKLPCSHLYHEHCIFPWLGMHRTCPLCRYRLNEDLEDCNPADGPVTNETDSFESMSEISVVTDGPEIPGDEDNSTE